jgi:ceramide glucosyltransferase
VIVETHLGGSWAEVWRHQVRWGRTIRVSKFYGYLGLPVTYATFWAVIAALVGNWPMAGALLLVRMLMALEAGWFKMRSPDVLKLTLLIPVRDLFGVAVWFVALFGNTVEWRGKNLQLDPEGRIQES